MSKEYLAKLLLYHVLRTAKKNFKERRCCCFSKKERKIPPKTLDPKLFFDEYVMPENLELGRNVVRVY